MAATNKYGLRRTVPEGVKRQVRQNCGFGCVCCGRSIVDYEHVDPDFAKARSHEAAKIALLCPLCHARVTRGLLSKEAVKAAMKAPHCKAHGFSFGELDPAKTHPFVVFAGTTLTNCPVPVQVCGVPLLKIELPECVGGPYRLSASLSDGQGRPTVSIRRNEWRTSSDAWDVEQTGSRITVRSGPRDIALCVDFVPAAGIVIERVDMFVAGYRFVGNTDTLQVTTPSGGVSTFISCLTDNCAVGMSLGG